MEMRLVVDPKRTALVLAAIVTLLSLASLVGGARRFVEGQDTVVALIVRFCWSYFRTQREANIPTWYQSSALLLCSLLLATIASGRKRLGQPYAGHWWFLAALFVFLSVDEAAEIHEGVGNLVRRAVDTGGPLAYAWVIPYGVFAVVLAVAYLRFLAHLPHRIRRLFLLAGGGYIGAAIGVEMAQAVLDQGPYLLARVISPVAANIEETLEMAAIVLFVYALLSYIASQLPQLRLSAAESGAADREDSGQGVNAGP